MVVKVVCLCVLRLFGLRWSRWIDAVSWNASCWTVHTVTDRYIGFRFLTVTSRTSGVITGEQWTISPKFGVVKEFSSKKCKIWG